MNAWKNSPFQNGYGGNPNYAYATGAYNPNNGFQQTAGVFPPNKVSLMWYTLFWLETDFFFSFANNIEWSFWNRNLNTH